MASPTFFSHFAITASEIDSPSLGITRSAMTPFSYPNWSTGANA
jgi:hypothetical protein